MKTISDNQGGGEKSEQQSSMRLPHNLIQHKMRSQPAYHYMGLSSHPDVHRARDSRRPTFSLDEQYSHDKHRVCDKETWINLRTKHYKKSAMSESLIMPLIGRGGRGAFHISFSSNLQVPFLIWHKYCRSSPHGYTFTFARTTVLPWVRSTLTSPFLGSVHAASSSLLPPSLLCLCINCMLI